MMIPVKIAANLSASGIDGVRWVLVDTAEVELQATTAAVMSAPLADDTGARPRPRGRLWLLKLLLLLAGLALAWFATHATIAGRAKAPVPSQAMPALPMPAAVVADIPLATAGEAPTSR